MVVAVSLGFCPALEEVHNEDADPGLQGKEDYLQGPYHAQPSTTCT